MGLVHSYPSAQLEYILLSRPEWKPYPKAGDRAAWEAFPAEQRQDLVSRGQAALDTAWPDLPATLYLRYARDGDRAAFEAPYFQRRSLLVRLVLAECAQGQGRFLDAIANAVWSLCEESSWCLPAHIGAQQAGSDLPDTSEPIVDLFAAETSALLAWTHYLLSGQLGQESSLVLSRIEREIQARILTPALERDDFWWMGFTEREVNNWNPWINSNWLASTLLIETDEARRIASVAKILRSLDRFILPYPADGGCDEGPSYWTRAGASLYDCLELLYSVSDGKISIYDDPKIQNIGRFIYRAHITEDYYVNFADAPALVSPDSTLVYGFGKRIRDPAMMAMGTWLEERSNRNRSSSYKVPGNDLTRALADLFQGIRSRDREPASSPTFPSTPEAPLLRDVYLPDIQFFAARDQAGTAQGLYLAAKGGHNAESHNHNDVGHFIVYWDGKPLIIDVGVETYTRKTFSPQRYEIWTMQSAFHSLPTIGGIMQAPGNEFAARDVNAAADDAEATFNLDIASAYFPEAHLLSWQRALTLQRGRQVVLTEAYEFHDSPAILTLSLLTPCQVDLSTPGRVTLAEAVLTGMRVSATGNISYDASRFNVSTQEITIADDHLRSAWGPRITRILFTVRNVSNTGKWAIFIAGGD